MVFANKWVWVAVVLLVSTLGAIIYLLAARKPAVLSESSGFPLSIRREPTRSPTLYGTDGTDGSAGTDQR